MKTALIFGLMQQDIGYIKSSLDDGCSPVDSTWRIVFFSSSSPKIGLRPSAIPSVLREASKHSNAHVFGFYAPSSATEKSEISLCVRRFFRFRWLDNSLISVVRSRDLDAFHEGMRSAFVEEQFWEEQIKPTATSSPALIPESSFATRAFADLWTRVESYGDLGSLKGVPDLIHRFTAEILKQVDDDKAWVDDRELVFSFRGARHAVAPFPRNWKYSYEIPDGFHYDVKHRNGKGFKIKSMDSDYRSFPAGAHANVDPHGEIRD
jgi:hypothetical protein